MFFWCVIVVWTGTIYEFSKDEEYLWLFIQFNLIRLPLIITATYLVLYFLIPRYLIESKQYRLFALGFGGILLSTILLDRVIIGTPLVHQLLESTQLEYRFFNRIPIVRNTFLLISIIGLAALIRILKLYFVQERRQLQLQEVQLATELAFLKAQVNPHFLFNALNNLYSMAVQREQTELAAGLENLSGIMRYLTYDSNAELVPLSKEIELLRQYIEIQQLRLDLSDDVTFVFNIKGSMQGQFIAPVLLLPMVENACKHGIRPDSSCLIMIDLVVNEGTLQVKIKNTLHAEKIKFMGRRRWDWSGQC